MRKFLAILSGASVISTTLVTIVGAWFVWELHPWMPAEKAFAIGAWRFEDFESQIWQRKNRDVFEPFADGLFVRYRTNQWQAFCFDIQDSYAPNMRLQKERSEIVIYRGGRERGRWDMNTQSFRRGSPAFTPTDIIGNPPGDWWTNP